MIKSDNGTNFVGADKQLHREFMNMDHSKISDFLSKHNGDWIAWKRNPPSSSNYGGVWERQIRTARNILSGMLIEHGEILHEESFQTLIVEVENVINSRPLTVESINDSISLIPISPMTLLTHKSFILFLARFAMLIYTVENIGVAFNISSTNFGNVGARNT